MALPRSQFELKIAPLVGTRRRASVTATFILENLQGHSAEDFLALKPKLLNNGLAPSSGAATEILTFAEEWIA